jgi:tetraacyldisaccharide 4'-kinase
MIVLRILLFPFALLWALVTGIRNRLYDLGFKPSVSFDVPVISVGNLAVGGTGKTPLVEHLIRQLAPSFKVATLSRGYGRKTKGFRMALQGDDARTLGDEPFQIFRKFGDQATISVGEDRVLAISMLADDIEDLGVILMDDAYQHRRVRPSFSILLTDYGRPFYKDFLMPAGRLREGRGGARRADIVVVTKCPAELRDDEMMRIEQEIRKYCDKPVFFAGIHYGAPVPFTGSVAGPAERVVLVSGIANPRPLETYVQGNFEVVRHYNYRDHHVYTPQQAETIARYARSQGAAMITTEKDAAKLDREPFTTIFKDIPCFYLPIEPEFIKNGRDFDEVVRNAIQEQHKKNDLSRSQE